MNNLKLNRSEMFRFPWSQVDNPGAWIEVTDKCNYSCEGCFRKNNLTGHRPLSEIKDEVDFCLDKLNCSRICISGGEPLLYPDILEVVRYISSLNLKPIILSNGELLNIDLLKKLEVAGLFQLYLHVDSGQQRPGWKNKTEAEMNELRQYYADLINQNSNIKCGYNLTIRRSNLKQVKDIVFWFRKNISKVNHLSLITFRGIPLKEGWDVYTPLGKIGEKELSKLGSFIQETNEIEITTMDIYNELSNHFSEMKPAAFLNGSYQDESYKYLIIANIGTDRKLFGEVGSKTVATHQLIYRLINGRYDATVPNPGILIFIMSFIDKRIRSTLRRYLKYLLNNPLSIFKRIHVQTLIIQQPFELINGQANLCEGCINLMPYKGKLINSCRLDEYRLLGGPITLIKQVSNA